MEPSAKLVLSQQRRIRVLVAEADDDTRLVLNWHFKRWGFAVTEARGGRHLAVLLDELLLGRSPDASLIDVIVSEANMPGRSALDELTRLREQGDATPVILTAGFVDAVLEDRAERLGAFAVFDKPFDIDDLCTAVYNVGDARIRSSLEIMLPSPRP